MAKPVVLSTSGGVTAATQPASIYFLELESGARSTIPPPIMATRTTNPNIL